ncbi:MAG: hypothetical protein KIT33_09305 [Candidatus Kapabacteria bacterium]|nr:hypothetical protein [Ignavibacteriota bacterium]MCW5885153.1 hypothetical protein [Candidatus Kapabacteria bacterium]
MDRAKKTDDFILKLIKQQPDIDRGKKMIFDAIGEIIPGYNFGSLKGLDFDRTLIEFENWLVQTITSDPLPISVKSIWFGLGDVSNKEDAATGIGGEIQITLKGSKFLPSSKPKDWFKKDLWDATGKQSEIKAFKTISNSLKNYPNDAQDIQSLVLVALAVVLLINGFDIIKHEFLVYQPSLAIGCGYETGIHYVVGNLTEEGIQTP